MTCLLPLISKDLGKPDDEALQDALREVQGILKELEYYSGEIDGWFGGGTEEAAKEFQRDNGLRVDGVIGNQTWSALYDYKGGGEEQQPLIYADKVSGSFARKVHEIADDLHIEANWLMAVMAFETGYTFDPAVKNKAGSGATGLIQFMPSTARGLGTTTADLAKMGATEQLSYVHDYFRPYTYRMGTLEDAYLAVLWPAAVGKPGSYVLFRRPTIAYRQNRGLDVNANGLITKWEAASHARKAYDRGIKELRSNSDAA